MSIPAIGSVPGMTPVILTPITPLNFITTILFRLPGLQKSASGLVDTFELLRRACITILNPVIGVEKDWEEKELIQQEGNSTTLLTQKKPWKNLTISEKASTCFKRVAGISSDSSNRTTPTSQLLIEAIGKLALGILLNEASSLLAGQAPHIWDKFLGTISPFQLSHVSWLARLTKFILQAENQGLGKATAETIGTMTPPNIPLLIPVNPSI
jgi:hypothetical protein